MWPDQNSNSDGVHERIFRKKSFLKNQHTAKIIKLFTAFKMLMFQNIKGKKGPI